MASETPNVATGKELTTTDQGRSHPARHRDRVHPWTLAFGLLGGPAVWSLHMIANYALASEACSPGAAHFAAHALGELRLGMFAVNIVALGIAALAGRVAYGSWRATNNEEEGAHEHLLEIGEGRTRFLSMGGMVLSGGFFAAILFDTLALLAEPLCA